MIDYKQMYQLLSEATTKSLYILSANKDEDVHASVQFLLLEATIRANHINTTSAEGNYPVEVAHG